tara:strand:+ start:799 stop:960 length:162 start_codon:yes stop_codon:yes gene_type:complete
MEYDLSEPAPILYSFSGFQISFISFFNGNNLQYGFFKKVGLELSSLEHHQLLI